MGRELFLRNIQSLEELETRHGEVQEARIPIAVLPDGTEVFIPLILGDGKESGPTLLLTALIHGVEIGGYDVIRRLIYEDINFNQLKGKIIAVPIANPFALGASNRFTPQDSADLNRVFPGNPYGSLSQRIAHVLAVKLASHANYCIDFHSCNPPSELFTIVPDIGNDKVSEMSWGMAEAFGVITVCPSFQTEGTFSDYLLSVGIPCITPELVFSRRFNSSSEVAAQGTMNVLKYLGMMDGELKPLQSITPFQGKMLYTVYYANKGGFVYFTKQVGDFVEKGEMFAAIKNSWDETIEEMLSPVNGRIIAYPMAGNQAVTTGDKIAYFAYQ